MTFLIGALLACGCALVLWGLLRLARRVRRKGIALVGPVDEAFHPAAHQARAEITAWEEHAEPSTPSPDKP